MESHFLVMAWIIVAAFAVTFVITILGLVQVIRIEPEFMKKLFVAMLLEIVSAGFFLFYKAFDAAPPAIDTSGLFVFRANGQPDELSIDRGDTMLTFQMLPADRFRQVPRDLRLEGDSLFVTTRDRRTLLGYIGNVRNRIGDSLMTARTALRLGLFMGDVRAKSLLFERSPHQAAAYLLYALRNGRPENGELMEKAVIGLHYLLRNITRPEDFQLLETRITTYRTVKQNRYFELAQAYQFHGDLLLQRDNEAAHLPYQHALQNYLLYLSLEVSGSKNTQLRQLTEIARNEAGNLITTALNRALSADLKGKIRDALKSHPKSHVQLFDCAQQLFPLTMI